MVPGEESLGGRAHLPQSRAAVAEVTRSLQPHPEMVMVFHRCISNIRTATSVQRASHTHIHTHTHTLTHTSTNTHTHTNLNLKRCSFAPSLLLSPLTVIISLSVYLRKQTNKHLQVCLGVRLFLCESVLSLYYVLF